MRTVTVGCLSSYNQGNLRFIEIEIDPDPGTMQEEIDEFLEETGGEEWHIQDSSGVGSVSEYTSLEEIAAIAELYEEHDEDIVEIVLGYIGIVSEARELLKGYRGTFSSRQEMAEELVEIEICDFDESQKETFYRYFCKDTFLREMDTGGWHFLCINGNYLAFSPMWD